MPATLRVPVAGWPKKRELGPLSSGQGKSMQFVDPDRIEQSDHVQAASFAPTNAMSVFKMQSTTAIIFENKSNKKAEYCCS